MTSSWGGVEGDIRAVTMRLPVSLTIPIIRTKQTRAEIQLALTFDRAQNEPSTGMTHRIARSLRRLGRGTEHTDVHTVAPLIRRGLDPLGQHFVESVSPEDRRTQGATFTPAWLITLMLDKVAEKCEPARVIDAGSGTGRYAVAAARRWPDAEVIAIEKDPVLAAAARVHAAVAKVNVRVVCGDYLDLQLPRIAGITAFIGNPPYVRHHDISDEAKRWYGLRQVVPSAVIGGCFNPKNLLQAQDAGLTIFWSHDLEKLGEFILATKSA